MKGQANEVPIFIQTYESRAGRRDQTHGGEPRRRLRNTGITVKALDLLTSSWRNWRSTGFLKTFCGMRRVLKG